MTQALALSGFTLRCYPNKTPSVNEERVVDIDSLSTWENAQHPKHSPLADD